MLARALKAESTAKHITSFEAYWGWDSAEMVRRAEGAQATHADHHAWLILLGRGDLIALGDTAGESRQI